MTGLTDMERRSLRFGGHEIGSALVTVVMDRSVLPEVEIGLQEPEGRHGAVLTSARMRPREISVRVRLDNTDARRTMDSLRRLAARLRPGVSTEPQRLVLPDEPARYYLAVVSGLSEIEGHGDYPECEVTFLCPDPVAYGQTRHATVGEAGTRLMAGGTWEARPTFEAVPPAGAGPWRVENRTKGQAVEVAGPFDGSTGLVLDMAAETCTYGGAVRAVSLESDYFAIDNGDVVAVSAGTAKAAWAERWL